MISPCKRLAVYVFIICIQIIGVPLQGSSPAWFEEQMGKIASTGPNPTNEQIDHLGILVRIGADGDQMDEKRAEVFRNAQAKLLSIPNHAEYFGQKIQERTAAELAGERARSAERWGHYKTLQQLPDPESVKVLGELLSDERGKRVTDDPVQDSSGPKANCRYAAQSLAVLIDPVPYDPRLYPSSDSALDSWRLWYAQVKAGTRTFKFKGSPVEYTLAGPATAAVRDSSTGSDHARSGKNTTAVGNDQAATPPGTSLWVKIATALAALLALVGGLLALRKKPEAKTGSRS